MDFLRREIALKFHANPAFYSLIWSSATTRKGVGLHREWETPTPRETHPFIRHPFPSFVSLSLIPSLTDGSLCLPFDPLLIDRSFDATTRFLRMVAAPGLEFPDQTDFDLKKADTVSKSFRAIKSLQEFTTICFLYIRLRESIRISGGIILIALIMIHLFRLLSRALVTDMLIR
jgi:hypothetical protein